MFDCYVICLFFTVLDELMLKDKGIIKMFLGLLVLCFFFCRAELKKDYYWSLHVQCMLELEI